MLIGRIAKASGRWWIAECPSIGAYTQGRSRKDAAVMLADCIETKVSRRNFKATVRELRAAEDTGIEVLIESTRPALLVAEVVRYQRETHGLSVKDIARKLMPSTRPGYVRLERGRGEPSLTALTEILSVIAPNLAVVLQYRTAGRRSNELLR